MVIAAVGNDGTNFSVYPAKYEGVIGVGATDVRDGVEAQSNFGSYLDVLAPGVQVPSLALNGASKTASGSSMAAPHVAGLASLLLSANPELTRNEVMACPGPTGPGLKCNLDVS